MISLRNAKSLNTLKDNPQSTFVGECYLIFGLSVKTDRRLGFYTFYALITDLIKFRFHLNTESASLLEDYILQGEAFSRPVKSNFILILNIERLTQPLQKYTELENEFRYL